VTTLFEEMLAEEARKREGDPFASDPGRALGDSLFNTYLRRPESFLRPDPVSTEPSFARRALDVGQGALNVAGAGGGAIAGALTGLLGSDAYGRALEENLAARGPAESTDVGFFEALRAAPGAGQVLAEAALPGEQQTAAGRIAKRVGGLVGDIAGDPANWVTGGLAGARQAARAGQYIPAAAKAYGSATAGAVYLPEIVQGAYGAGSEAVRAAREGDYGRAAEYGLEAGLMGGLGGGALRGIRSEARGLRATPSPVTETGAVRDTTPDFEQEFTPPQPEPRAEPYFSMEAMLGRQPGQRDTFGELLDEIGRNNPTVVPEPPPVSLPPDFAQPDVWTGPIPQGFEAPGTPTEAFPLDLGGPAGAPRLAGGPGVRLSPAAVAAGERAAFDEAAPIPYQPPPVEPQVLPPPVPDRDFLAPEATGMLGGPVVDVSGRAVVPELPPATPDMAALIDQRLAQLAGRAEPLAIPGPPERAALPSAPEPGLLPEGPDPLTAALEAALSRPAGPPRLAPQVAPGTGTPREATTIRGENVGTPAEVPTVPELGTTVPEAGTPVQPPPVSTERGQPPIPDTPRYAPGEAPKGQPPLDENGVPVYPQFAHLSSAERQGLLNAANEYAANAAELTKQIPPRKAGMGGDLSTPPEFRESVFQAPIRSHLHGTPLEPLVGKYSPKQIVDALKRDKNNKIEQEALALVEGDARAEQYARDIEAQRTAPVERAPERRAETLPIAEERRVGPDRRALAESIGLPEDHPAVERLAQAEEVAYTDPMMKVGNRAAFNRDIEGHQGGVASMDVGGLGWLNDTYGHGAGDTLIRTLGATLQAATRESPEVRAYRVGGDEVVMLGPDTETTTRAAAKAQELFRNAAFIIDRPDGSVVTYKGGRIDYGIGEGQGREAYRAADERLYAERELARARGERAAAKGQRPPGLLEVAAPGEQAPDRTPARAEAELEESVPEPGGGGWSDTLAAEIQRARAQRTPRPAPAPEELGEPKFATRKRDREEYVPELTALHNLTSENLLNADRLGGLAVPSIAITRGKVHEGYGQITLVGDRRMIDPKESSENRVYPADAYSGRYPETIFQARRGAADKLLAQVPRKEFYELGDDGLEALQTSPTKAQDYAKRSMSLKAAFLRENGVDAVPIHTPEPIQYEISQEPSLQKFYVDAKASGKDIRNLRPGDPEWAEFSAAVRRAINEHTFAPEDATMNREIQAQHAKPGGSAFDESGLLHYGPADRLLRDLESATSKRLRLDRRATEDALDAQIEALPKGSYEAWLKDKFAPLFTGEFVKIGRKKVPISLDAVVEAIRQKDSRAAEQTMTFGPGKARAAALRPFPSVEKMREARETIVPDEAFQAWKKENEALHEEMRSALLPFGSGDTWNDLDNMYRALADYLKTPNDRRFAPRSLRVQGFNLPEHSGAGRAALQKFYDVAKSIEDAPTEYFEAKPTRAVRLEEFRGAAIPDDAPAEVKAMLEKRGIPYEVYPSGDEAARQAIVDRISSAEGVKFRAQEGAPSLPDITAKEVKRAFAAGDVREAGEGAWEVSLPGERKVTVRVRPDGIEYDAAAFSKGYGREKGAAEEIVGSWQKVGKGGLVFLSKQADQGTVDHEAFHAAMDLALSPKEKAAVLKKFGDEEKAAEAYAKWQPGKQVNGYFAKILRFFRNLYRTFKPSWESAFERTRSGEAYGLEKPAVGGLALQPHATDRGARVSGEAAEAYAMAARAVGDREENFRRWFGEGQRGATTNNAGSPMPLYHGTSADFETFRAGEGGAAGPGIYLSKTPDLANVFAGQREGANVLKVYARGRYLKMPFNEAINARQWAERARSEGYDGLDTGLGELVVFDPKNIKSAIGNRGMFDPNDARLAYATRPAPGQRGLPGIGEDVAQPGERKRGPEQRTMFGGEMLHGVERRGTEGREAEGPLFTQESEARAKAEDEAQGTLPKYATAPSQPPQMPPQRPRPTAVPPQAQPARAFSLPEETFVQKAQRYVQDRLNRLGVVQESIRQQGGRVREDLKAAADALSPKVAERFRDLDEKIVNPLTKALSEDKLSLKDLDDYVYALHAPEANAYLATIDPQGRPDLSGMSDAEAQAIIAAANNSGKLAALRRAESFVRDMRTKALDVMVDGGLLSRTQANAWLRDMPNYVPLRTAEVDAAIDYGPGTGQGFDVRGRESKQRLGRRTKADSPTTFMLQQLQRAIVRAEKNKVDQKFADFVRDNGLFEMDKAHTRRELDAQGQVRDVRDTLRDAEDFSYKVNGERHRIDIASKDPLLDRAMKNLSAKETGEFVQRIGNLTRLYSQMVTSWNPEFVATNFARDIQTALANVSAEQSGKIAATMAKNVPQAMKAMYKSLRSPSATPTGWEQVAKEFREDGGSVGWYSVKDIPALEKSLQTKIKLSGPGALNRARSLAKGLGTLVEDVNKTVESGTRLALYKALRDSGVSREKAASTARNVTIDFNKKGEMGPAMNALYAFFNANIQGGKRLADVVTTKRGAAVAGGVAGIAFALDQYNRAVAEDSNGDGTNDYDDVPEYVKERNLVIMRGKGEKPLLIPMPYGFNVIYTAGRQAAALTAGAVKPGEAAMNTGSALVNAFNPLGSESNLVQILSPTALDPLVQDVMNKDFAGRNIRPEQFPTETKKPDSELYFKNVSPVARELSKLLNEKTGGDKVTPGLIDVSPETMQHYWDFATGGLGRFAGNTAATVGSLAEGETPSVRNLPFARRFVYEASPGLTGQKYRKNSDELDQLMTRYKTYVKERNRTKLAEIPRPMIRAAQKFEFIERQIRQIRKAEKEGRIRNAEARIESLRRLGNRIYAQASEGAS